MKKSFFILSISMLVACNHSNVENCNKLMHAFEAEINQWQSEEAQGQYEFRITSFPSVYVECRNMLLPSRLGRRSTKSDSNYSDHHFMIEVKNKQMDNRSRQELDTYLAFGLDRHLELVSDDHDFVLSNYQLEGIRIDGYSRILVAFSGIKSDLVDGSFISVKSPRLGEFKLPINSLSF